MNFIKEVVEYFSPHKIIARKLRWLAMYSAKHYFTIAYGTFNEMASDFENFEP